MPDNLLDAVDALLSLHGTARVGVPAVVSGGTLNQNYRIETSGGARFVRLHRSDVTAEAIRLEHRAMRWAGGRGIPVVLPLPTSDGATFHSLGGRLWSVFPWLEARRLQRGAINAAEAAVLGEMLGRLDAALASFPDDGVAAYGGSRRWSTEGALDELVAISALTRDDRSLGMRSGPLADAIALQIALLRSDAARPDAGFDRLPIQIVHGDYHDDNVLLDEEGQVTAVVDWEMIRRGPRIYHLLRCAASPNCSIRGYSTRLCPDIAANWPYRRKSANWELGSGGSRGCTTPGCTRRASSTGTSAWTISSWPAARRCAGSRTLRLAPS